jgi:hypothetical protein
MSAFFFSKSENSCTDLLPMVTTALFFKNIFHYIYGTDKVCLAHCALG